MKRVKEMWEKLSGFVSLASLLTLIVFLLQIGAWKANLEAKVREVEEVDLRLCEIEDWKEEHNTVSVRIETDLQWIKATLAEIKTRLE